MLMSRVSWVFPESVSRRTVMRRNARVIGSPKHVRAGDGLKDASRRVVSGLTDIGGASSSHGPEKSGWAGFPCTLAVHRNKTTNITMRD